MLSAGERQRTVDRLTLCLLADATGGSLKSRLEGFFGPDPQFDVVIERRAGDRRSGVERRSGVADWSGPERRRVLNRGGRRVGERRAILVDVAGPPLPARLRGRAAEIRFAERLAPPSEDRDDMTAARFVTRFQAGDRASAFAGLYELYFERVYAYLRLLLRNRDDAEEATQQAFVQIFQALPSYEVRANQPLRLWLFTVVRNCALMKMRQDERVELVDPVEIGRERATPHAAGEDLRVLNWITDQDLILFVERLPVAQRQVLVLRFMLDLSLA